jgi:uncharacterized membrane protein
MVCNPIVIAGLEVPCDSPVFLTVLAVHVPFGLVCVVTGIVAMLSMKGRGLHPAFGTIYYWSLVVVFASATALAAMRWAESYHLFILGLLSFAAAFVGRMARRRSWRGWVTPHIGHGPVLRPAADGVLRGQRRAPAVLEGTSLDCVLAVARRDRAAAYRSGAVAIPETIVTRR